MKRRRDEDDTRSVVVLQCRSCRTIVGDTSSLVMKKRGVIAIETAVSVTRARETRTSKEGDDRGCTYALLSCATCDAHLGRWYMTTPRAMDAMRDCHAFDAAALTTCSVGSSAAGDDAAAALGAPDPTEELRADLTKVQDVLLGLHTRLTNLEASVGGEAYADDEGTDAAPPL